VTDSTQPLSPPPAKPQASKSHTVVIALLFLLLCGAAGAAVWFSFQLQQQQLGHSEQVHSLQKEQAGQYSRLNEGLGKLALENQSLKQQLQLLQTTSQAQTQALAQLSGGNRNDWLLSEAEYLLRLAHQRLQLEQDVKGAELILSTADQVLSEIDDPALLPARIAVAEELLALQSLNAMDIQGVIAKLDALMAGISALPEKGIIQSPNTLSDELATEQNLTQSFVDSLSQAFTIRRLNQPVTALLPPHQMYYLQQNLRLSYEQALLSALSKNDTLFQSSLAKAQHWLTERFEATDPAVVAQLEAIESLKRYHLAIEIPDISGSLNLVKARIEALYRAHRLDKTRARGEMANEATSE